MPEWLSAVLILVGVFGTGAAVYAVIILRHRGDAGSD
jgi:hypothetical protein